MLLKLSSIFQTFARHREERIEKALTKQQWIYADRIIITLLFLSAVVAAVVFS